MQRGSRSDPRQAKDAQPTHSVTSGPTQAEDALFRQTIEGADRTPQYTPAVVRSLGRLVGNQAAQRLIQRAYGAGRLSASGHSYIQRDPTKAGDIANGHSYGKHKGEFGNPSQPDFKNTVQDVMNNPTETRNLSNGRKAYWKGDTVVIYNPNASDYGTCFKPNQGKTYFDNLT